MKPEQERLVTVLKDTISLLCKNSLSYEKQVVVQGLICVTVDKEDVLVVQVNDRFGEPNYDPCAACGHQKEKPPSAQQPSTSTPRPSENRKRPRSPDANRESSQPSPAKAARSTPRSQTSADSDSEGGDREESDAGGGGGGFELLPVKKEEMIEDDDDEDLVLIGEELGKHPTITGGGGYIDDSNSSSFQQQGQGGGDEPYITGFMQNTQIMPVAGGSQQQDSLDSSGAWDPNLSGSQGTEPSMTLMVSGVEIGSGVIHVQPENFQCTYCFEPFDSGTHLKQHALKVHRDDDYRAFRCTWPHCDKAYKWDKNLEVHMRVHTGEMPYECDYCGSLFRQKNSLNYHLRTKHKEEHERAKQMAQGSPKEQKNQPQEKKPRRRSRHVEEENDDNVKKRVSEILKQYEEVKKE